MATLKDVAKLADVSYTTVSLVLNGKAKEHRIPEITSKRILEAAKQLQYAPNIAAKRLKLASSSHYSIAVFWPADYRTVFVSRTITGLQTAINTYDFSIDTTICPYQNDMLSKNPMLHENSSFHGAIIVAPSFADMDYIENAAFPFPLVILNRQSSKHCTVSIDNYEAGKMAATYLLSKDYSDISAVLTKDPYPAMLSHQQGFLNTLCEYLRPVKHKYYTCNSMASGFNITSSILENPLPQVIFCDSDATARGLLCGLYGACVSVPRDTAVLAMGAGLPEASDYSIPSLSTIEIPHETLAERGTHLLIHMINKDFSQPCHLVFSATLKMRSSC